MIKKAAIARATLELNGIHREGEARIATISTTVPSVATGDDDISHKWDFLELKAPLRWPMVTILLRANFAYDELH